jgi:predicted thioesterase
VNGTSGPQVSHSVATTSGSGATVTTSTQTVNGKTVIVRTVHPAAYHDN